MERELTQGERQLAQSVYGSALNLSEVRLRKRRWFPFQPRNTVMAPCGTICFHPKGPHWSDDFSKEGLGKQGLFIHELCHTLQTQQRGKFYLPLMRHPFCRYSYTIQEGRPFDRYGLEQQAEIVRHIFLMRHGRVVPDAERLATLARDLPFGPL